MTEEKFYKPVGGILEAELFFVGEAQSLDEALQGQSVAVALLEDRSEYEQTILSDKAGVSVQHTLTLVSDRWLAKEWLKREFITRCSTEGVVARIKMATSESLTIGWDERFGTEQVLRLKELRFSTEKSLGQSPAVTLRLTCRNTHSTIG